MSFNKKFFTTGGIVASSGDAVCNTDSVDPFGDSNGVALYSLDYDASEASGSYDGTPTDVDFGVGGQINYGARFNGSSSSIETGISSLTNNFTISMWLNLESFVNSKNAWIFSNWDSTTQDIYFAVHPNGQLELGIDGRTGTNIFGSSGTFTLNTWHHFSLTMNNGTYDLYFNGTQLDSSGTTTNTTFNSGSNFKIGNSPRASASYTAWNGSIDQVRIFSSALTSDQVSTLYNNGDGETACVYDSTTDIVGYPASASSDIVAYYKLDNSSEDYVGSNDGTDTNIEYRFGRYGQAAVFNGSSSKIVVEDSTANAFGFANMTGSISTWVNPAVLGTAMGIAAKRDQGSPGNRQWILRKYSDNKIQFYVYQSDANVQSLTSTSTIPLNTWTHVVVTITTSEIKIYLNGVLDKTATTAYTSIQNAGADLTIGTHGATSSSLYWNGDIDQVRIYSTALDSDQVEELYNEKQDYITKDAADPFGDTNSVALYEMENNANDTSGNGNNGTTSNVTFTSTDPIRGTYEATFNGSTNDIGLPQFMGQNNYTFSAWFKTDALSDFQTIFSLNANGSYKKAIFLHSGGTNNIRIFSESDNFYSSNNIYNTNQWYHIVFTKSSTNGIVVYLDANEIINEPTATANDTLSSEGYDFIGAYRTGGAEALHFDGSIDQVRIFDRALDGTEAYQLYAEGARGTGL